MNEPKSFAITLSGDADISVPKNTAIYTDSFKFGDVDTFALSYIVACTGTPDIKIEMEQSRVAPATENVADSNFAVPQTIADIESSLTSKTIRHAGFTPLPLLYVRFKITEQTNSVTDTVVNLWLSMQKKFRQ
jgi:hypothetical protein